MPKYQYKAKNMDGNIIQGVYEAQNQEAVINMIRQKSFFPLEVKEIIERKDVNEIGALGKIKPKELSVYCKQFSSILKAGVPLLQSLKMVGEQTENKMLKTITLNVREEVQKGSSLANAMEIHSNNKLPPMLINMVEAGEMSGSLENSFDVMSVHFEKEHKTKSKVKSALRYPIIVSIVAVAVVILLMVKVVPIFANMFSSQGQELPLPTKLLMSTSEFLQKNGLVLLAIVVVVLIILKFVFMGEEQKLKLDKFKYQMPLFGSFLTKSATATFARNMSSLMSAGVSITEALNITGRVMGNTYAEECIETVVEQVKEGKGLYVPVKETGLFHSMLENMVMLGEESGTLDEMLMKTAEFYEEEVDSAAEALTSMIQPAVIVVLGVVVAFIVLAIAMPMFASYDMVS